MTEIVIEQQTLQVPQQMALIDDVYTACVQARKERNHLAKMLKEEMNRDQEWQNLSAEQLGINSKKKTAKARLLGNKVIADIATELSRKKLDYEGKRDNLSGHLNVHAKKSGHKITILGKDYYINQSAKLERLKD